VEGCSCGDSIRSGVVDLPVRESPLSKGSGIRIPICSGGVLRFRVGAEARPRRPERGQVPVHSPDCVVHHHSLLPVEFAFQVPLSFKDKF